MRWHQSYQGSHLKLAITWYGLSLCLALRSESRVILAGLNASVVQPAGRTTPFIGATEGMKKDVVNKLVQAAAGILVAATMALAKFPLMEI